MKSCSGLVGKQSDSVLMITVCNRRDISENVSKRVRIAPPCEGSTAHQVLAPDGLNRMRASSYLIAPGRCQVGQGSRTDPPSLGGDSATQVCTATAVPVSSDLGGMTGSSSSTFPGAFQVRDGSRLVPPVIFDGPASDEAGRAGQDQWESGGQPVPPVRKLSDLECSIASQSICSANANGPRPPPSLCSRVDEGDIRNGGTTDSDASKQRESCGDTSGTWLPHLSTEMLDGTVPLFGDSGTGNAMARVRRARAHYGCNMSGYDKQGQRRLFRKQSTQKFRPSSLFADQGPRVTRHLDYIRTWHTMIRLLAENGLRSDFIEAQRSAGCQGRAIYVRAYQILHNAAARVTRTHLSLS